MHACPVIRRVRRFELDAALTIEGADRAPGGDGERSRKLSPARLQLDVSPGNPLARETRPPPPDRRFLAYPGRSR
jgi:hypothetical protein